MALCLSTARGSWHGIEQLSDFCTQRICMEFPTSSIASGQESISNITPNFMEQSTEGVHSH